MEDPHAPDPAAPRRDRPASASSQPGAEDLSDQRPLGAGSPTAGTGIALSVLRWLEVAVLSMDYSRMRKKHRDDAWWVFNSGEVHGPVPLRHILVRLVHGGSSLLVVHDSDAHVERPPWLELRYTPVWRQQWPARLWTLGFWSLCVTLLFCLVQVMIPLAYRSYSAIAYWILVAAFLAWRFYQRRGQPGPTGERPE
jgi:hypothetical protein